MAAGLQVRPWQGRVYRHLPGMSPYGALETRFAALSREGRWHRAGEPTLVCATDRAVLADEFARHFERDRAPELAGLVQTRRVFEIELALQRVYDLTDAAAVAALGISDAPACFLNRSVARATAGFLRDVIGVEAILAPATVDLERPELRSLVVFLDRLETPLPELVRRIAPAGRFQVGPGSPIPEP